MSSQFMFSVRIFFNFPEGYRLLPWCVCFRRKRIKSLFTVKLNSLKPLGRSCLLSLSLSLSFFLSLPSIVHTLFPLFPCPWLPSLGWMSVRCDSVVHHTVGVLSRGDEKGERPQHSSMLLLRAVDHVLPLDFARPSFFTVCSLNNIMF